MSCFYNYLILFLAVVAISCRHEPETTAPPQPNSFKYIVATDISSFPEIAQTPIVFFSEDGQPSDFLELLKSSGINTIRLRLWVHPKDNHSGFEEVKQFSETVKALGFKTWLSVHYSDTWADPGAQELPEKWQELTFAELQDSVYQYTQKVMLAMQPDFIQIGNEINNGFVHPHGMLHLQKEQFLSLLDTASAAIRASDETAKIVLHYAGINGASWFFEQVATVDYDIIGLSYYPIWHGTSLHALEETLEVLSSAHNKAFVVAETAYPFTLGWNDWTNNIVGLEEHLILPDFPASPQGQYEFVTSIKDIVLKSPNGLGFCYWGAELVAWKGNEATDGSPWENQALFDFNNNASPVLRAFALP